MPGLRCVTSLRFSRSYCLESEKSPTPKSKRESGNHLVTLSISVTRTSADCWTSSA
jgi:hypothetical protein